MGRKNAIIKDSDLKKIDTAGKKKISTSISKPDKIIHKKGMTRKIIILLSIILLFFIPVIYFFWFSNGLLFYQENRSLFVFSEEYFQKFAFKPGGLLEYAGNFLTQFYFNPLFGSVLISALLIMFCAVFIGINKRLSADKSWSLLLIMVPSCLLLLLQTNYDHFMHYNLGYLFTVFWFLVSILPSNKYFRLTILGLFPVFYYFAGSFAWIYIGVYLVYIVVYEKGALRYLLPISLVVYAFLIFIIFKELLFLQPENQLLCYPLPFINISKIPVLIIVLGVFIILFPLFVKASGLLKIERRYPALFPVIVALAVLPLTVFTLYKKYNPELENLFQIEKAVTNQNWDAVIRQHENFPSANLIGQYYYNLALSEKGQLCDRLFFGRQDFGVKSLALPRDNEHVNRSVYFYYTVGMIGEAHHLAYESMVGFGYRPENVKLLIKTELINGNYKVAERYINVLKKTLNYRILAKKYEKMLSNHELISSDPELGEKIRMLPKRDFFLRSDDGQNIDLIFAANPDNKKAFEYKMARLMLEKNLNAVVAEVKRMGAIGYMIIPRHIEEAIVGFENLANKSPDLGGLIVSPETEQRFFQYGSAYNQFSENKSVLKNEMKKVGGNTLWYYLQF